MHPRASTNIMHMVVAKAHIHILAVVEEAVVEEAVEEAAVVVEEAVVVAVLVEEAAVEEMTTPVVVAMAMMMILEEKEEEEGEKEAMIIILGATTETTTTGTSKTPTMEGAAITAMVAAMPLIKIKTTQLTMVTTVMGALARALALARTMSMPMWYVRCHLTTAVG
jgi:hypothetical protein